MLLDTTLGFTYYMLCILLNNKPNLIFFNHSNDIVYVHTQAKNKNYFGFKKMLCLYIL